MANIPDVKVRAVPPTYKVNLRRTTADDLRGDFLILQRLVSEISDNSEEQKLIIDQLSPLLGIDCFKSCLHWLSMGYGSKAVCKTDSRISFFEGDGFYISQRDESLIGQSCNIFIVAEEGYEKYRGKVTAIEETLVEGKGYKILFTNEINNGIKYLSDNGLKPDGFINSLIVSGGVYGDTDVEIPDEFFSGAIGTNCLSGVGGLSAGVGCEALGYKALALLCYCVATAERAVAIGYRCRATGDESFARNCRTQANGYASDSSGLNTKANGPQSTAGGYATIAEGENQVTYGKFNIIDYLNKFIFILGNGKDGGNRGNAFTVDWDGNVECSGGIRCKGDIEIDGKGLLTTDKLGTFALTNYVAGVSGGLKVNLDCPVEADSWKVYINGKEITDENVGINDAFITAPALVEGEMIIAFFRDGEEILRCSSELTYKNNFIRCGILKGEI